MIFVNSTKSQILGYFQKKILFYKHRLVIPENAGNCIPNNILPKCSQNSWFFVKIPKISLLKESCEIGKKTKLLVTCKQAEHTSNASNAELSALRCWRRVSAFHSRQYLTGLHRMMHEALWSRSCFTERG